MNRVFLDDCNLATDVGRKLFPAFMVIEDSDEILHQLLSLSATCEAECQGITLWNSLRGMAI